MRIENPRIVVLPCPFCNQKLEFQINESIKEIGLTFDCLNCKKRFLITEIHEESIPTPVNAL
jgi:uncharacterized protein YbaR (Trm112 family)